MKGQLNEIISREVFEKYASETNLSASTPATQVELEYWETLLAMYGLAPIK